MAKITIGGEALKVSLPNFIKIEAAWRYISASTETLDPMQRIRAIIGVVAVGMEPDDVDAKDLIPEVIDPKVEALAKKLKGPEIAALRDFIPPLMIEIGLAAPAGEAQPAGEGASPSPETSTPSSAKSSPASDQPTGTA